MAQDFKLTSFEKSDFMTGQNYWCTGAFEGVSEPVKIVTPSPEKWVVGNEYYGEVVTAESKAGKPYLRFKREQRSDANQTSFNGNGKREYTDHHEAIKAQWAIGQAVQLVSNKDYVNQGNHGSLNGFIEDTAKELYAMVDRVQESPKAHAPKQNTQSTQVSGETATESTSSTTRGRNSEVWKQTGEKFSQVVDDEAEREKEYQEMLGYSARDEQPINFDDIPF